MTLFELDSNRSKARPIRFEWNLKWGSRHGTHFKCEFIYIRAHEFNKSMIYYQPNRLSDLPTPPFLLWGKRNKKSVGDREKLKENHFKFSFFDQILIGWLPVHRTFSVFQIEHMMMNDTWLSLYAHHMKIHSKLCSSTSLRTLYELKENMNLSEYKNIRKSEQRMLRMCWMFAKISSETNTYLYIRILNHEIMTTDMILTVFRFVFPFWLLEHNWYYQKEYLMG